MTTELRDFLEAAKREATELRFIEGKVGPHSAPTQVLEELWEVRGRIARVEELVLNLIEFKGKVSRAHAAAAAIFKDKFDEGIVKASRGITARMGDFVSKEQRAAEVNLELLMEKREERQSGELLSEVIECYDYLRFIHRGLESSKQDLQSAVRTYQIESSIGGRR